MYINFIKLLEKEISNEIIEQKLDNYKQFFEEIENKNKNKLLSENKNLFENEEKKNITKKFIELRNILFNNENDKIIDENPNIINQKNNNQNIEVIYNKVMKGNFNKNELTDKFFLTLIEKGKSIDLLEKCFKLYKDLYQLLYLIDIKFYYILDIYKAEKNKIKIDEIIGIETNPLDKIKAIHKSILLKEQKKIFFNRIFRNNNQAY